jgi:predicted ferric reductase
MAAYLTTAGGVAPNSSSPSNTSNYSSTSNTTTTDSIVGDISSSFLTHINFFLLFLFVLYVLSRVPRALALFLSSSEWGNGHFLRSVELSHPSCSPSSGHQVALVEFQSQGEGAQSASPPDNKERLQRNLTSHSDDFSYHLRLEEGGARQTSNFPRHIPSTLPVLRPLLKPLRTRLSPGFSNAQLLVLLAYFCVLVYAGFYKNNIFTDVDRTGWVATAQLPLIFGLAAKNGPIGWCLGMGYEKLNFLHRFAGRLVVVSANIHSLHYFYQWFLDGTFIASMRSQNRIGGMIALILVDISFLFSTEFMRKKAYNLFLGIHTVSYILVLPALYIHHPAMRIYLLVCLIFLFSDLSVRVLKSRLTYAYIRPIPELEMTRIHIPSINAGWRAGQHVRLHMCLRSTTSWVEAHPLTITSVSKEQEGMVLMCKKANGWTKQLYEMAKVEDYMAGLGRGRRMRVVVEGPYGGPGLTMFASFSAAVFVAGGSGITYALSVIQDLVQKDLRGESRVKVIELVWVVPDPACLSPLLPTFSSLIHQSVNTSITISVFYTRAPTGKQPAFFTRQAGDPFTGGADEIPRPVPSRRSSWPCKPPRSASPAPDEGSQRHPSGSSALDSETKLQAQAPTNDRFVTLAPGRPCVLKSLTNTLDRVITLNHALRQSSSSSHYKNQEDQLNKTARNESLKHPILAGVVVGVCGPVDLADDVVRAVGSLDPVKRDQVGGVEICEEVFGW